MATNKTTTAPTAAADTAADTLPTSRAYMVATVDEETGEESEQPRFRYLPGHPRQIRFDAKKGEFNINGTRPLGDTLSFIPVALRMFSDDILSMGRKEWAELFFIDAQNNVCAVLFHGYSVENLKKLNSELFYDDLKLTDVMLTVSAEKKDTMKEQDNGKGGKEMKKATYFIAEFKYKAADQAEVQARQEFAYDFPLYREETLTDTEDRRITQGYRLPEGYELPHRQAAQLSGGTE